jgi:hypothetical protein
MVAMKFFLFGKTCISGRRKKKKGKGKIQLASNPQGLQYMHHLET